MRAVEMNGPDDGAYAFGLVGSAAALPSTYSRSFATLHAPEPLNAGTVKAIAHGVELVSAAYSAPRQRATSARAILRTPYLYIDNRHLKVAFQLRDTYGNTQVSTSGLVVTLAISTPSTACNGAAPLATGCTSVSPAEASMSSGFDATTGVGKVETTLPTAFFQNNGRSSLVLAVRYQGDATSRFTVDVPTDVALHGKPVWYDSQPSVLTQDGMFAAMPVSPRYAAANPPNPTIPFAATSH